MPWVHCTCGCVRYPVRLVPNGSWVGIRAKLVPMHGPGIHVKLAPMRGHGTCVKLVPMRGSGEPGEHVALVPKRGLVSEYRYRISWYRNLKCRHSFSQPTIYS